MEEFLSEKRVVKNIIDKVDGLISQDEGEFLYNMAKDCKGEKGAIVEIGSYKGRSAICLGKGSKAGSQVKIYAIDPHKDLPIHITKVPDTYEVLMSNIQFTGVSDIVLAIVKTSAEAAKIFNETVQFLFIDGNHDYEAVKLDFDLWYPKVINGGIIAFHDHSRAGPLKVIKNNILSGSKHFADVGIVDSILFARKVRESSLRDRIKSYFIFFIYKCRDLYYCIPMRPTVRLVPKILKALKIMQ